MIKLALVLGILLASTPAQGQPAENKVEQSGDITPGHGVKWITTGVIGDAGTAVSGFLTGIGVIASGPGICQNSGPIVDPFNQPLPYNQICLSSSSSGGQVLFNNVNGATGGFQFVINTVPQSFPSIGLPTSAGFGVCFLNNAGQLTNCGGPPALIPTGLPVVIGNGVCFSTTGGLLADCGGPPATVTGLPVVVNHGVCFSTTGGLLADCGQVPVSIFSLPVITNDAVCFHNTSGQLADCGGKPVIATVFTNLTTTYNTSSADCGKFFSLGGNAFYSFTINAPGGYPTGCQITVVNTDTVRGKGISVNGLPTTPVRLFPGLQVTYTNNGTVWQSSASPTELRASPGGPLFVNFASGSNNALVSDCFATGTGACKTFQQAVDIAQQNYLPYVSGVTIQADCEGTYTQTALGPSNSIQVYRGLGSLVNFVGNSVTPTNCRIIPNISTTILDVQDGQQATISGFEFGYVGTNGTAVSGRQIVIMDVNDSYFANNTSDGTTGNGGVQVSASDLASVNLTSVTLNGTAAVFVGATGKSAVQVNFLTIPASGTANFAFWFDVIDSEVAGTPLYTIGSGGSVAGAQFACSLNAVINLATAYPVALSAGSAFSGCQHSP
jgi:hypothetical protein